MRLRANILRNGALTVVASLALTGCFKKVTHETTVIAKAQVEQTSGGERTPSEGVVAYAYYTDSEAWTVASYDDAVNKIVTSTEDGTQLTEPDVEGEPFDKYETGCYTALPLKKHALIVVIEPQVKMYACMFKRLTAENLPQTFLTLIFHPWKDKEYTEGSKEGFKWQVFPPVKSEEGGESGGNTGDSGAGSGDSGTGSESGGETGGGETGDSGSTGNE